MIEDNTLKVVVRKNPFEKPLLETKEASTIEIRDADGLLAALVVIIPGTPVFMLARNQEEDFESFAKSLGIKMRE
jgi:MFS-type transporter involved in bile tolerance (Atg22 family)